MYAVHDSSVIEYDASGAIVSQFGGNHLATSRGVAINGSTGNVYVSSNPSGGSRVVIFGPAAVVTEITTGDATNVTGTSATLNGRVDPANGSDVTECHFEYDARIAGGEAVAIDEVLPDRHRVAAGAEGRGDQLAVRLTGTRLRAPARPWRPRGRRRVGRHLVGRFCR